MTSILRVNLWRCVTALRDIGGAVRDWLAACWGIAVSAWWDFWWHWRFDD